MDNRRRVFDRLAREIGFDPLVPQNWYQLPRNDIVKDRVCIFHFILFYFILFYFIYF